MLPDFGFDAFALPYETFQLLFEYLPDSRGGFGDPVNEVVYLR